MDEETENKTEAEQMVKEIEKKIDRRRCVKKN